MVMGRLPGSILPRSIVSCAERLASEFRSRTIAIDATDDVLSVSDMNCLKEAGFQSRALVLLRQALPDGSPVLEGLLVIAAQPRRYMMQTSTWLAAPAPSRDRD